MDWHTYCEVIHEMLTGIVTILIVLNRLTDVAHVSPAATTIVIVQVIATVSATDADDAQHTHVEYQLMPEAGQLFIVHHHTYASHYCSL